MQTPHAVKPFPERFQNVYWLGGGSGAGKSTIARRIAAERGLSVYATDDAMADHARRSTSERAASSATETARRGARRNSTEVLPARPQAPGAALNALDGRVV